MDYPDIKVNDLDIEGGTGGWRVTFPLGARDFTNWDTAYGCYRSVNATFGTATISPVAHTLC